MPLLSLKKSAPDSAPVMNFIRPARDKQPQDMRLPAHEPKTYSPARGFDHILQTSGYWLLAGDVLAVLASFICGGIIAIAVNYHLTHSWVNSFHATILSLATLKQGIIFIALGGCAMFMLGMRGHYRQRLPYWESVGNLLSVAVIGFMLCGFLQFVAPKLISRFWLGTGWALFGFFLFAGRSLVRRHLENKDAWQIPALLIGEGRSADAAIKALERESKMGFSIVRRIPAATLATMSPSHGWRRLLMTHGASHIFLALEGNELDSYADALKSLMRERLPCSIVPPWMGLPTGTISTHHFLLHDVLLMHDTNRLTLPLPCLLKRSFDILCSGTALLLLSPVFILVAAMVRLDGGPAFFRQPRVGRNGAMFDCYKFRSMRVNAEAYLVDYLAANPEAEAEWNKYQKLKNDVRITPFGQFIRRLSIDELPQLINVLKGDMSLVGPRPIMPEQAEFYGDDFIFYESVRPGITGPWQVSGRNQLTFHERVTLECCYARNWSLWMDVVILLKTIPVVLKRDQAF